MKYRPEIDGLRAVAVVPVILFHAGFKAFGGGFVGVDVFFVISGYLITTIILSEMEEGRFSLLRFYERRARRILPALFFIMLLCLPFAWFWLMPGDLRDFSQSLVAVSSFCSNVLFWRESGYWESASELKPLLHTWSLAVEEQYYMLFPLFLMFMWRLGKRWIFGTFMLVAVGSLALAHWGATQQPAATFYLLHTRGWELAIGAAIAFSFLYRKEAIARFSDVRAVRELLGGVGLLLIGVAIFAFDKTTPFPSLYALLPTVGAGLLIVFASPHTLVGRLLGLRPLVGIGLLSYSAYLWHQPLFAFARHRTLHGLSQSTVALLVCLSFPLAYLSWRFVEAPFRAKGRFSRKTIFSLSVLGSVMFFSIGLVGHKKRGFGDRVRHVSARSIEKQLRINHGLDIACDSGKFTLAAACRTHKEPEILVWGDSYAMHLVQGIQAAKPGVRLIQHTKSFCGPFFEVAPISPRFPAVWAKECLAFNEKVRTWLAKNKSVKYVVLSSLFYQYITKGRQLLYRDGKIVSARPALAVAALRKTVRTLKAMGKVPVIFSPPPTTGQALGQCLARAAWLGLPLKRCDFRAENIAPKIRKTYKLLERCADVARLIRLDKVMCQAGNCKTHAGSSFLYRDTGHLSRQGAAVIGKKHHFYRHITQKH